MDETEAMDKDEDNAEDEAFTEDEAFADDAEEEIEDGPSPVVEKDETA